MALDVNTLAKAHREYSTEHGTKWVGLAHGVQVSYVSLDPTAEFWVSPIWTMREKGVALVDSSGQMVANNRRDR